MHWQMLYTLIVMYEGNYIVGHTFHYYLVTKMSQAPWDHLCIHHWEGILVWKHHTDYHHSHSGCYMCTCVLLHDRLH